ncbi:MAG: hypothetical protein FJX76_00235 [Armatimonadetes bacterium]|nr:hypothetical protein [Armatimonadota bacterium]
MTSSISTSTQNRPTTTQPAQKSETGPTTTSVKTVDASVRTQDGRDVQGYGLDLDRDNRYDGARDGVLAFDFDKNGDLSDKEVKDTRDGLQAFGGNNDLDGSGGVDEQEKATADRLAGLVRQFDANNDGKLNNQELKAAGAGVIGANGVQSLDELTAGDSKASLKELDPKNASAVLDLLGGANDPNNEKPAADAGAAPAAGGPASPKGPTIANPDAPAGFLWKPTSDSDGNLVILLPPNYAGKVQSVRVLSPDGQVLDEGKFSGVGNGDRPHFRFKKPGASFPNGSQVEITMNDGSKQTITIENTSMRNEGTGKGK